ncbi:MAG: cyclase family protein [Deltaproteobacteria bacterium]
MRNRRLVTLTLLLLSVVSGSAAWFAAGSQRAAARDDESQAQKPSDPLTLDQVVSGQSKIVDLGWSLNDKNPYWPAADYEPFRLKTIATLEKNGVLSKAFFCPEHLGTHLDAPNHFEMNQPAVDQIEPASLFAHGVVIDIASQSGADADYRLTRADIADWEKTHGRIPEGAVVLLHTGWGRHWNNYPRYKNQDAAGKMHFPGYSAEAAKFLVAERRVKGLGIDTLSIDYGLSKDFVVHHIVNGAGRYGLENVARLDMLPPRGFYVVAAPIKIETGSGGPTRLFAILKK